MLQLCLSVLLQLQREIVLQLQMLLHLQLSILNDFKYKSLKSNVSKASNVHMIQV